MDISDDNKRFTIDFPKGGDSYGWCCFVCGGSGSGKTHWVVDRIERNLKVPKRTDAISYTVVQSSRSIRRWPKSGTTRSSKTGSTVSICLKKPSKSLNSVQKIIMTSTSQ